MNRSRTTLRVRSGSPYSSCGRVALGLGLDRLPAGLEALDVVRQLLLAGTLGGGAHDDAGRLGDDLLEQRLETGALGVGELAGDAAGGAVRHVDQEPAGQADLAGEPRALVADRVLGDLHQDALARGQHRLDLAGLAVAVAERRPVDLTGVQHRVAALADVDERRLHRGQHVLHPAEVDVADDRGLRLAGDVVLDEHLVLEHADLGQVVALAHDHDAVDRLAAGQELGLADDRGTTTTGLATVATTLLLGLETRGAGDRGDLVLGRARLAHPGDGVLRVVARVGAVVAGTAATAATTRAAAAALLVGTGVAGGVGVVALGLVARRRPRTPCRWSSAPASPCGADSVVRAGGVAARRRRRTCGGDGRRDDDGDGRRPRTRCRRGPRPGPAVLLRPRRTARRRLSELSGASAGLGAPRVAPRRRSTSTARPRRPARSRRLLASRATSPSAVSVGRPPPRRPQRRLLPRPRRASGPRSCGYGGRAPSWRPGPGRAAPSPAPASDSLSAARSRGGLGGLAAPARRPRGCGGLRLGGGPRSARPRPPSCGREPSWWSLRGGLARGGLLRRGGGLRGRGRRRRRLGDGRPRGGGLLGGVSVGASAGVSLSAAATFLVVRLAVVFLAVVALVAVFLAVAVFAVAFLVAVLRVARFAGAGASAFGAVGLRGVSRGR